MRGGKRKKNKNSINEGRHIRIQDKRNYNLSNLAAKITLTFDNYFTFLVFLNPSIFCTLENSDCDKP